MRFLIESQYWLVNPVPLDTVKGERVDQRGFWNLLRSRWVALVTFTILGVIAASVYVLTTEPEYSAEAELFVSAIGSDSTSDLAQGSNYSQQQARNYSIMATRQIVLDPVITALGLKTTVGELGDRVSASVPLNTSLISIAVTDTSPDRAAATADAVATSLVNTVIRLVPKRSDGTTPLRLESVQSATTPTAPSAPSPSIALASGLLGGFVAGLGFILLRELTSAKVRTAEQLRQFGLTLLGTIVYDRGSVNNPLVPQRGFSPIRAEEFKQVRTNLHFLQANERHKVFVVTSSIPGEGKSVTAANLAITLAASGSLVCLVEADLRRPSLADYFDLEGSVGLSTILAHDADVDDVLQSWGPDGLQILLSGQVPPNPSELLSSTHAQQVFASLRDRFNVVVIDCPPLLPVTDAAILGRYFGGAVLVVGSGKVETRELRKAVESLKTAGTPLLGAILNLAPARLLGRNRGRYYMPHTAAEQEPSRQEQPVRSHEEEVALRKR
ncbi:polysaccharide biosynthesis tyrosine autokinase [Cryobacterium sp. TMT1-62]|nr:polysaccharide biosynthesis tyrosine autokinase [Cryobacterium sp. Hz7]TFC49725.1 polysaccharide biosynthesis tyrosine autokinase [Cryobacterium sp. TMT2-17-1]TFD30643.1 polysaccharide biosynthesis tyrosine autokinase [Cryobacterium sp. TMT1-62]